MFKHKSNMIKNEQQKIGRFIAGLRDNKGLTQKEFAKCLKTTQSAIARMERGQQNFSTEMLAKISKIFGKNVISLGSSQLNFKIEGGHSLSGSVITNTSKNTAVALLCASLLNKGRTMLRGVPKVDDVYTVIKILKSIGVKINWLNETDLIVVPPIILKLDRIDKLSALKTRSTLLLIGAILSRLDSFSIPHSGGCKLGARTIKPHLFALEKFGVSIKSMADRYEIKTNKKHSGEIILYESSDTATENAIMTASVIEGRSVIKYASANYMVQELCQFLSLLGVRFEGVGTTSVVIYGKSRLSADIEYDLGEDPIESMLFLAIASVTGSSITIKRCPIDFLEIELLKLEKMGLRFELSSRYKSKNGKTDLVDIKTFSSKLHALDEKIYARPYPGLNIDNLPFFVPIAVLAKGTTLIHDWVYENRAIYYLELNKLGAQLRLADPHRVFIEGPAELRAAEVICPPALRPAAIVMIAMMAARGVSILRNVYSISRGYENLCQRLQGLGAKIEIFPDL